MKYTVTYPDMVVHRAGCQHLRQKRYRTWDLEVNVDANNVDAAIDHELDEELVRIGYDRDSFTVMPCAEGAKGGAR